MQPRIDQIAEGEYFYDATHLKKNINFKAKSTYSKPQKNINFKENENEWFSDLLPSEKHQIAPTQKSPEKQVVVKKQAPNKKPDLEEKENLIKGDDLLDMLDF